MAEATLTARATKSVFMAEEDFDTAGLAAYLHLQPAQIGKLAERGKLPGRRVGGQWRFSPGEIHHWLEERIGLSDEDELVQMEGVLGRPPGAAELAEVSIRDLLPREAIEVPLIARTRNSVITQMVEAAARTGWLWDPDKVAEAVRLREEMHPTALDSGVALLHPRRPLPGILGQAFLTLGVSGQGLPFGGSRAAMTDIFFLVLSTDDRGHLRTLARLSRLVGDAEFLAALRAAGDPAAALEAVRAAEERLK
jgi:PTS system nitrogen regulatory IIA component